MSSYADSLTGPLQPSDLPAPPLADFCRAIGAVLATAEAETAPARIAHLLPRLLAVRHLLSDEHRTAPPEGYGRHCLFVCPEGRFSVLAMVWPAGFRSPAHDHITWCAFGVYEGRIEERRYRPATSDGEAGAAACETARIVHRPGSVAHLPLGTPDIHDMRNPTDRLAISLHVYGGDSNRLGPNVKRVWLVEP